MTLSKARPIIFGALFLAWLGYLFFLVLETDHVVIAKPQFQVAQVVLVVAVRADGDHPDPMVTVKEVLKGDAKDQQLAGQKVRLPDLLACKKEHGFAGAGDYVVPLMQRRGEWQIVPLPIPPRYLSNKSHGTLELRDAGPHPECVLWRLLEYSTQKPLEADGLLQPLMPQIATCYLGNAFFGDVWGSVVFGAGFSWQQVRDIPPGTLPRRLPIADALTLKKELEKCKAVVDVTEEEVRIYPLTPKVREQVEAALGTKT